MRARRALDLQECGTKVAELCHREYGLLVGSGTTALTLACRMVPPSRRKILVPAVACVNVLFSILYAECTPVFVDITLKDGLINPDLVRVALERDHEIGAVLVVHTYGHIADTQRIAGYARARGVLVIEDAAQAQGGVYADGAPIGALGDLSVISFGHTKTLDVGGGGVLMYDRIDMHEACLALEEALPSTVADREARFAEYRSLYYAEWNSRYADPSAPLRIAKLHHRFREIFLHQADEVIALRIVKALPMLFEHIAARRELATTYATRLAKLEVIRLCTVATGSVPWRLVFRVPAHQRDPLVEYLRLHGVDVSSWYPSLANFYTTECALEVLPNADTFAKEVVNLWVTPGYGKQQAHVACDLIDNYFR